MIDSYITVNGERENLIIIEKSKFYCNIFHIETEDEVKEYLGALKKKYPFANHYCYAYILDEKGVSAKCSDAGEPQGTAGVPMLEALKNSGLKKVLAVTTRFFGGIKLGAGGLVRAYSNSVTECAKLCDKVKYQISAFCSFYVGYDNYSKLLNILNGEKIEILQTTFDQNVKVEIALPLNDYQRFYDLIIDRFNGEKLLVKDKEDFFAYRC